MNEKLSENTNTRIYINNCFGKNVNAYIGPLHDGNIRTIFGQGGARGGFYKLGQINIETGEIFGTGEQNVADANTVISKL